MQVELGWRENWLAAGAARRSERNRDRATLCAGRAGPGRAAGRPPRRRSRAGGASAHPTGRIVSVILRARPQKRDHHPAI